MKKLLTVTLLFFCQYSIGQQNPQYSQYLRNQFMVNPAAAGVYDFLDITIGGRWQWLGFDDSPKTSYLSGTFVLGKRNRVRYNPAFRTGSGPVKNPEIKTGQLKHALGGQLIADQYGAFRRMSFNATYAIHLPISKNINLSFGAKAGLSNHTFLQNKAVVLNTVDPSLSYSGGDKEYDAYVANGSSKMMLDVGTGMYLYSKKMFFGLAADNLTRDLVEFGTGTANFNTQLHFNATYGLKLKINENLMVMPAVLIKLMSPAPISIEGSVLLEYKEWLWSGISYRHNDAIIPMIGLNVSERFKFGYSYDYSISRFNEVSSGGHEIVLGLMLGR
jgi:type IX secretion system PorP/SprF family membrane protein